MSDQRGFSGLALGSASALAAQGVIVSLETLSREDRDRVQEIVRSCRDPNRTSVAVGVMRGHAAWDLRPLLLETAPERGSLSIIRLTDPDLSRSSERLKAITLLYETLAQPQAASLRAQLKIHACGQLRGQFWMSRRFFPRMLPDTLEQLTAPGAAIQLCQRLLSLVSTANQRGVVHGHLTPENIAIDGSVPVIVDIGFMHAQAPADRPLGAAVAPEVARLELLTEKCDVFALGMIMERVLGQGVSPDQATVLTRMQSMQPDDRPSLRAVEQSLFPSARLSAPGGPGDERSAAATIVGPRVVAQRQAPTVRSGRVVGGAEAQMPQGPQTVGPRVVVQKKTEASKEAASGKWGVPKLLALRDVLKKYLLLVSGLLALIVIGFFIPRLFSDEAARRQEYQELWSTKDRENQQTVVLRALSNDDSAAIDVILQNLSQSGIRAPLLRTAFASEWRDELSAEDRRLALTLGLSGFLTEVPRDLPPLHRAHPAVVMAVVGDLALNLSEGKFSDIPVSALGEIPGPRGLAFRELGRLGSRDMGELGPRALSRVLVGDGSVDTVRAYLHSSKDDQEYLSRLLVILPFGEVTPGLYQSLMAVVGQQGGVLSRRSQWFSADASAQWEQVGDREKLLLIVALFPETKLSFEQLADLMVFPAAKVRAESAKRLRDEIGGATIEGTLQVLGSEQNSLTRSQVILLLAALQLKEREPQADSTYSLIARWFGTRPDAQTVLALLAARKSSERLDPFNIEAARYLASKSWRASIDQLKDLTQHTEPLARALAYSRLDATIPAERALLSEAVKKEQVLRMRQEIENKLNTRVAPSPAPTENGSDDEFEDPFIEEDDFTEPL